MHWVTSLGTRPQNNSSLDRFQYHTREHNIRAEWGLEMRLLGCLHFTSKYGFPKSNGTIPTFHNNIQLRGEAIQYHLTITTPCPVFHFPGIYMSLVRWYPVPFSWSMTAHSSAYYYRLLKFASGHEEDSDNENVFFPLLLSQSLATSESLNQQAGVTNMHGHHHFSAWNLLGRTVRLVHLFPLTQHLSGTAPNSSSLQMRTLFFPSSFFGHTSSVTSTAVDFLLSLTLLYMNRLITTHTWSGANMNFGQCIT